MASVKEIAEEISILMPTIARNILFGRIQDVAIPHSQIFMMFSIEQKGECKLSDLSKDLKVTPPTVTGIVDRLEKAKYVKRQPSKTDRRQVNVILTGKGKELLNELRGAFCKAYERILSELPKEDVENYISILRKIRKIVE